MTEKRVGAFELDSQTLYELGTENVGVLIGGNVSNEFLVDHICELAEMDLAGTVVVAASSEKLANWCYSKLDGANAKRRRPDVFEIGCVTLTTPEKLRKIKPDQCLARPVLSLILLDPICVVHRARGEEGYGWAPNDRPQHLARFRYEHKKGGWQPPMLLMTTKAAKSLNTNHMLAPYSLEGWWFVDAPTLRIGPNPQMVHLEVALQSDGPRLLQPSQFQTIGACGI